MTVEITDEDREAADDIWDSLPYDTKVELNPDLVRAHYAKIFARIRAEGFAAGQEKERADVVALCLKLDWGGKIYDAIARGEHKSLPE